MLPHKNQSAAFSYIIVPPGKIEMIEDLNSFNEKGIYKSYIQAKVGDVVRPLKNS